jgi:hypothetical protein
MLVIRDEQMEALRQYMLRSFQNRMVSHLRTDFPEETSEMSDEELQTLVQTGMDKAESYGIVYEDDIQRFLDYMLIHGPDFDQDDSHPEVQAILRDEEMDGEEKMDEIDSHYSMSEED